MLSSLNIDVTRWNFGAWNEIVSFTFLLFLWDNASQKLRIPLDFAKCKLLIYTLYSVPFSSTFPNLFYMNLFFFSGKVIIALTGSCFSVLSLSLFDLVTASKILFSKNSLALWTTFWKQFLRNLVLYLLIVLYFLRDEKNLYQASNLATTKCKLQ